MSESRSGVSCRMDGRLYIKRSRKKECKNYRGTIVTTTVGSLCGRIIKQKLDDLIEFGKEQSESKFYVG